MWLCVYVCESVRGREKEHLWTTRQDGGWITILKSIIELQKYLQWSIYHMSEVNIGTKCVSLILNVLGSGGSRISHLSTRFYLRFYSQHF